MKKRMMLILGIFLWLVAAVYCYAINGYLGILVIAAGALAFWFYRRGQRKQTEAAAPAGGLYTGLQHGVIYLTERSVEECIASLERKADPDGMEYDFSYDREQRSGSLALYCKKGGIQPSNFPSSFVVSFANKEQGVWILVRYLDVNAKRSLMTRVEVDAFVLEKCGGKPIGMRKAPEQASQ